MKLPSGLKLFGMILGGIGLFVASEVQKREINDAVEKQLNKRLS